MAYRPTARTETQRLEQRQKLVAAAQQAVRAAGFAGVSIASVAATAGLATGSFYRHFAGKAELCAEVFRLATQREVDVMSALAKEPLPCRERLVRVIQAFGQRAMRGRRQAYALIAEPVDPLVEHERLLYRQRYSEIFVMLIEEGIRRGEFAPQAASVSAAALVGALAETLVGPLAMHQQANTDFNDAEENALVTAITHFCLRAITGKETPP
jgi:AcrR family transcriptional regulator